MILNINMPSLDNHKGAPAGDTLVVSGANDLKSNRNKDRFKNYCNIKDFNNMPSLDNHKSAPAGDTLVVSGANDLWFF